MRQGPPPAPGHALALLGSARRHPTQPRVAPLAFRSSGGAPCQQAEARAARKIWRENNAPAPDSDTGTKRESHHRGKVMGSARAPAVRCTPLTNGSFQVDYSGGFSTFSTQRFGQRFVNVRCLQRASSPRTASQDADRRRCSSSHSAPLCSVNQVVANPKDVLLFHRRREKRGGRGHS